MPEMDRVKGSAVQSDALHGVILETRSGFTISFRRENSPRSRWTLPSCFISFGSEQTENLHFIHAPDDFCPLGVRRYGCPRSVAVSLVARRPPGLDHGYSAALGHMEDS